MRILRNAFAIGRVAHAFMLHRCPRRGQNHHGPDPCPRAELHCARTAPVDRPPIRVAFCANCLAILARPPPTDVIEMDAASRTGVGDMRELIEATRFRPMQARTKVFIVDEVHMLSNSAFNALLRKHWKNRHRM